MNMIEVKTLDICSFMPVEMDNEFPFFYEDINEYKEDVEITQHPIRPWITIKHKNVMIDGKRKTTKIETWVNTDVGYKPVTPDPAVLLGYWDTLCKPYLVADSYELMKQGLIKQMRKPKHFKHNICQLNNNTISGKTINQRLIGMLNTKTRKQCTYTPGTSYCINCGECKPHNYAVESSSKKDKTGLTFAYPNIRGYEAFHTDESILFYYDSMRPYRGHDINKIRSNISIKNPLSKSDNDITVIERVYLPNGETHDFILHHGHDYSRIKAFDKEPEFIIHNGKRICRICGKRLRHRGRYCKSHSRSEINRFNRKISYITNYEHTIDSYTQSSKLFTNYNDLNGVDYREIYNTKFWLYTGYLEINTSTNMGKTEINRIAGTRNEYRNRTINKKSKTRYANLIRNMGFGHIDYLYNDFPLIIEHPHICMLHNTFKYQKKSGAENKYHGIKPKRFCKHIIHNDNGEYRCDCLRNELVEAKDCNTWYTVKVYGHYNDNITPLKVTYLKPEYSPSAYTYTGLNPPIIPTMEEIPPEKLSSNIFINTSNNYKKTKKMIFDRYVITPNKLGHPVYYHLNSQETVPVNNILIPKAKRISRQLLSNMG